MTLNPNSHSTQSSPLGFSCVTKRIQKSKSKQSMIQGFLSWSSQDNAFRQQEIQSMVSVGRDSGQIIVLNDPFTSRRHVRIEKKEQAHTTFFILKDMSSRNGTFLNGNKIFQAVLKNNDRILIGQTEFIFSSQKFNQNWEIFNRSFNPKWSQQLSRLPSMACTDFSILIHGPTGTGKEHVAQMIHEQSPRSSGPYISVNCSALSENLAESEFFGHIKGSYTGASSDRKGAFLAASGGTLFLDEIGDLPLNLQPKLLRALEYKEIKPVGSDQTIKVDVRIVSATHQNLQKKVLQKEFREDLYFRLRVLEIKTPHLKDRIEDFDSLLEYFSIQLGVHFSKEAKDHLKKYSWPGNIRELKNTVSRAKAFYSQSVVTASNIEEILDPLHEEIARASSPSYSPALLKQLEKEAILRVLKENDGNKKKAADQLNMPRTTLTQKLKNYNTSIKPPVELTD